MSIGVYLGYISDAGKLRHEGSHTPNKYGDFFFFYQGVKESNHRNVKISISSQELHNISVSASLKTQRWLKQRQ